MMRQLGGSLGVAMIATYIENRSWVHRQDLLRHVTPYDFALQQRWHALVHGLTSRGSSLVEAQRQAYGVIEGIVTKQTFLLTYMDAFRLIGIFFLCCLPLLLLFKRSRPSLAVAVH